jgi:hypothetical protein
MSFDPPQLTYLYVWQKSASLRVRIPNSIPAGTYRVNWSVKENSTSIQNYSTPADTEIVVKDHAGALSIKVDTIAGFSIEGSS